MKLISLLALSITVFVNAAAADPIDDRKTIMKERGGILRVIGPVAQGQQPFDAATVIDALERLAANAEAATEVDALWPAGSEAGDTKSAPNIWTDRAGFQAASDKFAADAAAAAEAAPQDLDAFRAVFGPVAANCGTCHEAYRL